MNAWIEVSEVRSRVGDKWRVAFVVSRGGGITTSLFVYRLDDGTYSHPCTADDVDRWPETSAEAERLRLGFYRKSDLTRDFDSPRAMSEFIAVVRGRLRAVCESWPGDSDYRTPGSDTYVLGGDS